MSVILLLICVIDVIVALSDPNYVSPQSPDAFAALDLLRGKGPIDANDQFDLMKNAVPGVDYPINAQVPNAVECGKYAQAGYYADTTAPSNCQGFHRCDENGIDYRYLCPNGTVRGIFTCKPFKTILFMIFLIAFQSNHFGL